MHKNFSDDLKTTSTVGEGFHDSQPEKGTGSQPDTRPSPEITSPRPSDATKIFPDEVPRRDGPGGE